MPPPSKLRIVIVGVVLAAVTVLVYAGSFDGPFIYDDVSSIVRNRYTRSLWPLSAAMTAPPQSPVAGRPVVSLTLALNYHISGLRVWSYHALNLTLHIVNALLLTALIHRSLGHECVPGWLARARSPLAIAVGFLWAVHPLNSEAVLYVTQRTELLAGFFCLLALWLFARGAAAARPLLWYAAAVLACVMGVLSKEVAYAIAPMILLYDRAFVAGSFNIALRRRFALHAALHATWIILAIIVIGGPRSRSVGFDLGIGPLEYMATQTGVVLWYLRLCFLPWPLSIHYEVPVVSSLTAALPAVLFTLFAVLGSGVALVKWPRSGLVVASALLILAPTSSFVPIVTELAAERRMYLPLAAVLVGVACAVCWLSLWRPALISRTVLATGVVLLAATAGGVTARRVASYDSAISIWQSAVDRFPDSAAAHGGLGNAYFDADQYDPAQRHLEKALQLNSNEIPPHRCLAETYLKLGQSQRAIVVARRGLELDPTEPDGYAVLGETLSIANRHGEAEEVFGRSLKLRSDHLPTLHNLANHYWRAGRIRESLMMYERVLEIDPAHGTAWANIGIVLAQHGQLEKAEPYFRAAIALGVETVDLLASYATLRLQQGELDEAAAMFRRVLDRVPEHTKALSNLSVILRRQDKLAEAADLARRRLALEPNQAEAHNNLGVILARQNRMRDAIAAFARAVELDPNYTDAKENLQLARQTLTSE